MTQSYDPGLDCLAVLPLIWTYSDSSWERKHWMTWSPPLALMSLSRMMKSVPLPKELVMRVMLLGLVALMILASLMEDSCS